MAHILVVDDSPTELHVIKGMLEKHGFQVTGAQSGEEGVELAKRVKPDLVLMDVVMPGLNGFQATRQLAREPDTASIPIIMVTTKDQETDKVWAMRQGAKDYIVKPAKEKDLVERVNGLLRA
ncbi:MAG: response regulator [Acidihalobacter sp.]|jgi:twitching motility two-component system response regulator PilH|uniref:response regulator n=1 Tax=Acidihalobacter sp. TaxID=1872108 RepID=UPI00307E9A26